MFFAKRIRGIDKLSDYKSYKNFPKKYLTKKQPLKKMAFTGCIDPKKVYTNRRRKLESKAL